MEMMRQKDAPAGMSAAQYARWRRGLGEVMTELRRVAKSVLARSRAAPAVELLELLRRAAHDPTSRALVEHVCEFAAFHLPGPAGRTVAECAVRAGEDLPAPLRAYLPELASSYWELFEVLGLDDAGALELRRLHDDEVVAVQATELTQPLAAGSVAAFRLFDAGGFVAAPVALVPDQDGLAGLVSQLEIEQSRMSKSRADFMRARGNAVVIAHAVRRHRLRVAGGRPMPEPQVSLLESDLAADQWLRLDEAFRALEQAVGDRLGALAPLTLERPTGGALRVEQNGASMAVMLFESTDAARRLANSGQANQFVRVWRARADELFAEDVDLLDRLGLAPVDDGAVVAVRLEDGLWEDVAAADVDDIVAACRWAALRISVDGELAA